MYFRDLDQAYLNLNKDVLEGNIGFQVFGTQAVIMPLMIQCSSIRSSILNLSNLGYTELKMKSLKSNYLDDNFTKFLESIKKVKKQKECIYVFKEKWQRKDAVKQNCLRHISYNKAFNTFTVVWRTAEISTRWGADLLMLADILKDYEDSSIILILPHSFQDLNVFPGVCRLLGWKSDKLIRRNHKEKYINTFTKIQKKFYPRKISKIIDNTKWSPIWKLQRNIVKKEEGKEVTPWQNLWK